MKDVRRNCSDPSRVGVSDRRIVCVKFRHDPRPADGYAWFRRGSRDTSTGDEPRKSSVAGVEDEDMNPGEDVWSGDTMVFVIHMLTDHGKAFVSVFLKTC